MGKQRHVMEILFLTTMFFFYAFFSDRPTLFFTIFARYPLNQFGVALWKMYAVPYSTSNFHKIQLIFLLPFPFSFWFSFFPPSGELCNIYLCWKLNMRIQNLLIPAVWKDYISHSETVIFTVMSILYQSTQLNPNNLVYGTRRNC